MTHEERDKILGMLRERVENRRRTSGNGGLDDGLRLIAALQGDEAEDIFLGLQALMDSLVEPRHETKAD